MTEKRRVFLHVGLPKTASSALQLWAAQNRPKLLESGIDYPQEGAGTDVAKHQNVVSGLLSNNPAVLNKYLAAARSPTLFLSTEGLTNHLYDFSSEALTAFREQLSGWQVTAFLVLRQRESWINSYWKQSLVNPRIEKYNYATGLTCADFAQLSRTQRLSDFDQVAEDVRAAYGVERLIIAQDFADWFTPFRTALNLPEDISPPRRVHVSVTDDMAEIIRQMNSMDLSDKLRHAFLALFQHSQKVQHDLLCRYAEQWSLTALFGNARSLVSVLDALTPTTPVQYDIVQSMEVTLATSIKDRD